MLYADELVVIAEGGLIKRLSEWKDGMYNMGMRVDMHGARVVVSGEQQRVMQRATGVVSVVKVLVIIRCSVMVLLLAYAQLAKPSDRIVLCSVECMKSTRKLG